MNKSIQMVFSMFVLAMWASFGVLLAKGDWSRLQWCMLAVAHVACLIVFVNFVYVFNYGYAMSVAAINAIIMISRPSLASFVVGGVSLIYGLRLWYFVYARNRAASYGGIRDRIAAADAKTPLPLKIMIWILCSWLMAFHAMTTYFAATNYATDGNTSLGTAAWIGALIALAGIVLEAVADSQKQVAKQLTPGKPVTSGLFARTRHPNYSGEIIYQLGIVVMALGVTRGWLQLLVAVLSPLYIVVLMYYAAQGGDAQQRERYGKDAAWNSYYARSGTVLPKR